MGQRVHDQDLTAPVHFTSPKSWELSVFLTDFGWFGLAGQDGKVTDVLIGHASPAAVHRAFQARHRTDRTSSDFQDFDERDWNPSLKSQLQQFAQGIPHEFRDVEIEFSPMTEFQSRVISAVRNVKYGETISYAELACRANSPRAARAVGNVMASNRLPILVPCHRVVATGGRWGGFSAPQGVDLKKRLLSMEAEHSGSAILAGS